MNQQEQSTKENEKQVQTEKKMKKWMQQPNKKPN